MGVKWTEERKKAWSEHQKKQMNCRTTRRRIREKRRQNRENGLNLVNIEQMASDEAYRDYQREYKRIYYADPEKYAAWKKYTRKQKLMRRDMADLIRLRNKHIRNGHDDWAQDVQEVIDAKGGWQVGVEIADDLAGEWADAIAGSMIVPMKKSET